MIKLIQIRIQISAPRTPGAAATIAWGGYGGETLAEARVAARELFGHRADLRRQDVRIERATGELIEYAGPCR